MEDNVPKPVKGTEKRIEADLIVSAIGQTPDIDGLEDMGNEKGFFEVDNFIDIKQKKVILLLANYKTTSLTTAIGQGSIAADSIKSYFENNDLREAKSRCTSF